MKVPTLTEFSSKWWGKKWLVDEYLIKLKILMFDVEEKL